MTQVDKDGLIKILGCVAKVMTENRDLLCKLDAEMGDGDLGLTMSKAFPAAEKEAIESDETDLGKLMMKCGMKMNSAAPSTMGTLMSSGFVYAGKALAGKTALSADDFAKLYMLFADGVAARGKAQRGERTVLDTLYPAADTAAQALLDGAGIAGIASAALAGAQNGLEATKDMLPKYGKAAVFVASAQGKIDQGALAGALFIEGIRDAVAG
ncbi:MAG: dihydroxyacetone kinase subunit L [Oscillospiraceae bacterium]|nr:dihydroxyacetone kinase subunit L [Oscillospiraceae bacterium]